MCNGLCRALRHLLALAASCSGLSLRFFAVMLPETDIHIAFHIGSMFQNVAQHTLLNGPPEEVELAHGRLLNGRMPMDLERDTLTATEWVKETLGICLELALVVEVHQELFALLLQRIADIVLLGIVGDEPVH